LQHNFKPDKEEKGMIKDNELEAENVSKYIEMKKNNI